MTHAVPARYARTVHGSGPGLLLAHGAGGSSAADFGPIMDGLAARHTVVGVDHPGSGATPASAAPLELDDLADRLVAAADAEGLDTFAVWGYSLGGTVALRVAARHPQRITALVLSAAFARLDTRTEPAAAIRQQLHDAGQHLILAQYLARLTVSAPVRYEPAAAVPGARTAELATGHLPFLEQPDRWRETITGFLAEQDDAR
ncbi:alpha/beta fold hydrolase [Kitasatospora sp. NPDC004799]|uniref:alpha/beta fold hydrolase n=1 Tax=Kitasatospora sp. NPDC004799 TaxID=3154460 RepID=UPI0033AA6906